MLSTLSKLPHKFLETRVISIATATRLLREQPKALEKLLMDEDSHIIYTIPGSGYDGDNSARTAYLEKDTALTLVKNYPKAIEMLLVGVLSLSVKKEETVFAKLLKENPQAFKLFLDDKEDRLLDYLIRDHREKLERWGTRSTSMSLLHHATKNKQNDLIKPLIDAGCNPEEQTDKGLTPLMLATEDAGNKMYTKTSIELLRAGANPTFLLQLLQKQTEEGYMPLEVFFVKHKYLSHISTYLQVLKMQTSSCWVG